MISCGKYIRLQAIAKKPVTNKVVNLMKLSSAGPNFQPFQEKEIFGLKYLNPQNICISDATVF